MTRSPIPPCFSLPGLALFALVLLPGCFWGETESQVFFQVAGANYENYKGLLYPSERDENWAAIFGDRGTVCSDGDSDCSVQDKERSDLVDFYVPFDTDRARGLLTQKGDLQITAHLDMGEAYTALVDGQLKDWCHMSPGADGCGDYEGPDKVYGRLGQGCDSGTADSDRTGVGVCLRSELEDNANAYAALKEDLRLVLLINLPGADDIRSTRCQDRPTTFASDDWTYPRTLRVNYDAREPVEVDDGEEVYGGEDEMSLAQCDIEVFGQLQLGSEVFAAASYGADDEDQEFTLGRTNDADETMLGTVELESLVLPGEDGSPRATGRFNIHFSSERFVAQDGTAEATGSFDVEIRRDAEEVEEPERALDLEHADAEEEAR